jgi:hypothetical protein
VWGEPWVQARAAVHNPFESFTRFAWRHEPE